MNKFKKILLGALSVLTLGLFVVTGAKVEAQSFTNGDSGFSLVATNKVRTYTFAPTFASSKTFNQNDKVIDITVISSATGNANNGFIKMNTGSQWKVPVPSDASGNITISSNQSKKTDIYFTVNEVNSTAVTPTAGKSYTLDADGKTALSFTNEAVEGNSDSGYYLIITIAKNLQATELKIELDDGLFVSTPSLEAQENSAKTAVRFIATVSGVTSEALISSWTVTMSLEGKTDYVVDFTDLYVSVGGENGKTAVENTVYLVGTLKNIPSTFSGTINTKVSITLADGNSTKLVSNTVSSTFTAQ